MENDSSDDDILYSINSDMSDIDSDETENDSVSGESTDDESVTTNISQFESWSGKIFKSNLPYYDGELKLSTDFESKIPRNASPIDFFLLYFTPELVSYIVDQSNLYRIQNNKTKQSPMTETDFNLLMGFLFYSSAVPLPNKRDYWSSFSRQSVVADVITRDRIMYLLSILHFHDNSIEKNKVEKFEPILKYFNERCKLIVQPEKNLSIDEQMIAYKGTTAPTSFRQFMPKKPTKRGFKVWTRCGVSGFMYEMKFYCGASKIISDGPSLPDLSSRCVSRKTVTTPSKDIKLFGVPRDTLHKQYGSSGLVVLDLVKDVPVGSSIFIDNYFASTKLIKKLTQLGFRVTCTLRSNRVEKCPVSSEKQFEHKKRGYYEHFISDDKKCIVIGWKDSKRVLLGSNHIGTEPETMVERWDKEKRCKVNIVAPQIISQYNKFMGGVDTLDMLVALHPIPFRSKRWYTRIVWRIFDLMIINAWIIMNTHRHGNIHDATGGHGSFRLFHFKLEIAKFLLQKPMLQPLQLDSLNSTSDENESDEENEPPPKKIRESASSVTQLIRYDGFDHWPTFVSSINNTRCKNENCSGKTYWKCSKCNVHLCLHSNKNCFTQYHTRK
jgi:hypothetical protein